MGDRRDDPAPPHLEIDGTDLGTRLFSGEFVGDGSAGMMSGGAENGTFCVSIEYFDDESIEIEILGVEKVFDRGVKAGGNDVLDGHGRFFEGNAGEIEEVQIGVDTISVGIFCIQEVVDEAEKISFRHLPTIEEFNAPGSSISRVCEDFFSLFFSPEVEGFSYGDGHHDFSTNAQHGGDFCGGSGFEDFGEIFDGFYVEGDVFSGDAIATGDCFEEFAILVDELDCESVIFRLNTI